MYSHNSCYEEEARTQTRRVCDSGNRYRMDMEKPRHLPNMWTGDACMSNLCRTMTGAQYISDVWLVGWLDKQFHND